MPPVKGMPRCLLKERDMSRDAFPKSWKCGLLLGCVLSLPGVLNAQTPAAFPAAAAVHAPDLIGQWQGTIHPTDRDRRVVLKFFKGNNGALTADLFFIDQDGRPLHASSINRDGSEVKIAFNLIGASVEGKLNAESNVIDGFWKPGDHDVPLVLSLTTKETAWEIPAPPAPPKMMPVDANPEIDVSTVKPNNSGVDRLQGIGFNGRLLARNASLLDLISFAYDVQKKQVIGLPDALLKDRYDIDATVLPAGFPSPEQLHALMGKLVVARFGLTFHQEKRELSAYVLTVVKDGPKFQPSEEKSLLGGFGLRPLPEGDMIPVRNMTMDQFSKALQSLIVDRPVVNRTGLTGRYDLSFKFTPDDSQFNGSAPKLPKSDDKTEPAPSIFEAFQEQLGLKLSPEKTQVDVMVIDKVTKPSEN